MEVVRRPAGLMVSSSSEHEEHPNWEERAVFARATLEKLLDLARYEVLELMTLVPSILATKMPC